MALADSGFLNYVERVAGVDLDGNGHVGHSDTGAALDRKMAREASHAIVGPSLLLT